MRGENAAITFSNTNGEFGLVFVVRVQKDEPRYIVITGNSDTDGWWGGERINIDFGDMSVPNLVQFREELAEVFNTVQPTMEALNANVLVIVEKFTKDC
jgi:hypothetical protein